MFLDYILFDVLYVLFLKKKYSVFIMVLTYMIILQYFITIWCQRKRCGPFIFSYSMLTVVRPTLLARLSQGLWTTTPKNFYHPNQHSTRCVLESFNSWLTVRPGVVVRTRWLNLATVDAQRSMYIFCWLVVVFRRFIKVKHQISPQKIE